MKFELVFWKQLAWMVAIWVMSVVALGLVAGLLRWWLLG
ncbi:DUF2474 family protein [Microbulbifer hainanensis]|nr:DUF2474 family protein [Microbulbifer hainanensis]